jgi:hypothetical protein
MLGFLLKVTMDAWYPAQGYLECLVACSRLPWMHGCLLQVALDTWLIAQVCF